MSNEVNEIKLEKNRIVVLEMKTDRIDELDLDTICKLTGFKSENFMISCYRKDDISVFIKTEPELIHLIFTQSLYDVDINEIKRNLILEENNEKFIIVENRLTVRNDQPHSIEAFEVADAYYVYDGEKLNKLKQRFK